MDETRKLAAFSEKMKADDLPEIRRLLEAGADANVRGKNGATPLYMASRRGLKEIARLLIDHRADVNAREMSNALTPLLLALQNGHEEVVKLLLDAGADVNTRNSDGVTPLFMASQMGRTASVKRLLEAGADVNAVARNGATPLLVASREGRAEAVRLLLAARADVSALYISRGGNVYSALILAEIAGHEEVVRILKEHGA